MKLSPNVQAVVIVGPTASGKTAAALKLAKQLDTEILSADSMQFYCGMEIGTAAPTPEERAQIPHHFVSCINPDQRMAAGVYQELARAKIQELNAQGKPAVVVGGSGLYISALVDGLFSGPASDQTIRERLQADAAELGNAQLYARLQKIDPDYAALLTSENDLVRVVRALEVYELCGQAFSKLHREHQAKKDPLDVLVFGLQWDRAELYARINQRVLAMVDAGWVEEVRTLLEAGYGPQLDRLKALGYREIAKHLHGEQDLDTAIAATQMHHRRYAKRQLTWFRADARVQWVKQLPEVQK